MSWHQSMLKKGTIFDPKGIPNPEFACRATVNWMRGLSILMDGITNDPDFLIKFYDNVRPVQMSEQKVNTIFGQLLYAIHQCSALRSFQSVANKADIAEVGIVTWYYGIYACANAMLLAKSDTFKDNHTGTANVWFKQIAANNLIPHPFDLRVSTLTKKECKLELQNLYSGPKFNLAGDEPLDENEAIGAIHAYLSGSTVWWRETRHSEVIRKSNEFKNLNVNDFRTKKARELLDKKLEKSVVGFLHQAFRYRGKANYRDSMYLGHGKHKKTMLNNFDKDLSKVLETFSTAAGEFCSRRLGKKWWNYFMDDIEKHHSFSLSPKKIWRVL